MKTEWDYTTLARAYLRRPNYSGAAIDVMLSVMKIDNGEVCDIGAGAAHLTLELLNRRLKVIAIEPNDATRENGAFRTEGYKNISWHKGTGEVTGQNADQFDLVTFGSSFNVCNRERALQVTLARQAGEAFKDVIKEIANFLNTSVEDTVKIPYSTKIWIAQAKKN